MKARQFHSAGGLVIRDHEILLISTRDGRQWQLPKGRLEAGETSEQAAVREIREETGVCGRAVRKLGTLEYDYPSQRGRRTHKRVDYYLLQFVSGSSRDFDAGEVSGAEWFSWEDGLARLTFDNERSLGEQAYRWLADSSS